MTSGCRFLLGIFIAVLLRCFDAFEVTLGENSKCTWTRNDAGLDGIKKDLETSIRTELKKELLEEMDRRMDKYKPLLQLIRRPNDTRWLTTEEPEVRATLSTEEPEVKTTLAPIVAAPQKSCPVGYVAFEDSCYDIKMYRLSWNKAQSFCRRQGAELVSINSVREQRFLADRLEKHYRAREYWIGMTNGVGEAWEKKWSDGTTVNYTSWGMSQPSCFRAGCRVLMSSKFNYSWIFNAGTEENKFICETRPRVPQTTAYKSNRCPESFARHENHCYMFERKKAAWYDARGICQRFGADLVSINSQAEQDFLEKEIKEKYLTDGFDYFWIGLIFLPEHNMWVDGTSLNYSNWGRYEPNCMQGTCKAFLSESYQFQWEDAGIFYKYNFICEIALLDE